MPGSSPRPPRYNRYHVYLAVFGVLIVPIFSVGRVQKACGHALHGYWPAHRCTAEETWLWLKGGGNWEAWIFIGLAVATAIAFVVGVLRD